MMVQILSISLVLNFALTEVLVPQRGALTESLTGEAWRLKKCSHVNCVKIQLTVDSALCPVLKVLNPAPVNSARLKSMRTTHAQSVTIEAVTFGEWTVLCRE